MNLEGIQRRAREIAKSHAEQKAWEVHKKIGAMLGISGAYGFPNEFNEAMRPLRAFMEKHIADQAMSRYWSAAQQAAIDTLKSEIEKGGGA